MVDGLLVVRHVPYDPLIDQRARLFERGDAAPPVPGSAIQEGDAIAIVLLGDDVLATANGTADRLAEGPLFALDFTLGARRGARLARRAGLFRGVVAPFDDWRSRASFNRRSASS